MIKFSNIVFYGKKRKLYFTGSCLDVINLCEGMCCREWNTPLTEREFQYKRYGALAICNLTKKECKNNEIKCTKKGYVLKKKRNGACIYLDNHNKCSIYLNRPQNCRNFYCKNGWYIGSTHPTNHKNQSKREKTDRYHFRELSFKKRFMLDPAIKLKALSYLKEKQKIIIVGKMFNKRSFFVQQINFRHPKFTEKSLFYLFNLFDGRNTLKNIFRKVNREFNLRLSKKEFFKIISLLRCLNIMIVLN